VPRRVRPDKERQDRLDRQGNTVVGRGMFSQDVHFLEQLNVPLLDTIIIEQMFIFSKGKTGKMLCRKDLHGGKISP
jgi:hypothetical protein